VPCERECGDSRGWIREEREITLSSEMAAGVMKTSSLDAEVRGLWMSRSRKLISFRHAGVGEVDRVVEEFFQFSDGKEEEEEEEQEQEEEGRGAARRLVG